MFENIVFDEWIIGHNITNALRLVFAMGHLCVYLHKLTTTYNTLVYVICDQRRSWSDCVDNKLFYEYVMAELLTLLSMHSLRLFTINVDGKKIEKLSLRVKHILM